jgi:segregation and condensation protein A
MENTTNFEIKLPQFEGPFDLLLFFIERDELNIQDIPIAKITDDFLDYIHKMTSLNIELAGDFILVASTLMRIKAKMLLPRKDIDNDGNEIDPREDLINRLLEYKKYKEVLQKLETLGKKRSERNTRGNIKADIDNLFKNRDYNEEELHSLDLYSLLKSFEKVMTKHDARTQETKHTIVRYPYTIQDQKAQLMELLSINQKLEFTAFLEKCENKVHLVYTFLAILELLQVQELDISQGEGFNNFWLSKKAA